MEILCFRALVYSLWCVCVCVCVCVSVTVCVCVSLPICLSCSLLLSPHTGVISLASNLVVLWMFVKFKELRTATNAIIINLCLTDIGVAGIGYPMSAASDLHGSWKFGYNGCQVLRGTKYSHTHTHARTHACTHKDSN